jgi:NADH-quinone oxidoreductase subunit J
MAEQIIFYLMAIVSVVFSILAVTTKHIIRSATYLLFVLLSTAGLYLVMQYYYLFAVQIIVYGGGIMVLYIFAILLTNKPGEAVKHSGWKKVTGAGLLSLIGVVMSSLIIFKNLKNVHPYIDMESLHVNQLGLNLLGMNKYQYLIPFEAVSILLLAGIIGGIMIARKR